MAAAVRGLRQPWLGIAGTLICLPVSLAVSASLPADYFMGWVSFALIAATPLLITAGAVWQGWLPLPMAPPRQPLRAVLSLCWCLAVTAILGAIIVGLLGPGETPLSAPGPGQAPLFFVITAVPATLWLCLVGRTLPFTALRAPGWLQGALLLGAAYGMATLVFFGGYDFTRLAADARSAVPTGLFDPWAAAAAWILSVNVILAIQMAGGWPNSHNVTTPTSGRVIAADTAVVLPLTGIVFAILRLGFGMPGMAMIATVIVPFAFGQFILLTMLENAFPQRPPGPVRGALGLLVAGVLGVALYQAYAAVGRFAAPHLGSGAAGGYQLEFWVATAMLSVTFPVFMVFSGLAGFWPLRRAEPEA